MKRYRPSPAMVVAFVALIAATAGTALAATGQLVNIVDPVSSTAARVDQSGYLKVASKPSPGTSFARSVSAPNYYATGGYATLIQTNATLALGRIQVTVEDTGSSPWDGAIWYQTADAGGTCNGDLTRVAIEAAQPGTTHLDELATPVLLKPAS